MAFLGIRLGDAIIGTGKGVTLVADPMRGSPAEKEAPLAH